MAIPEVGGPRECSALLPRAGDEHAADVLSSALTADDIEIGCGSDGDAARGGAPMDECHWVVLRGDDDRGEAAASAPSLSGAMRSGRRTLASFPESYFPYFGRE